MSHLDEGQLHALLDGELDEDQRRAAEEHLGACADCRRLFDEARDFLLEADALVAAVDLPPAAPSSAPPPAPPAPPVDSPMPKRRLPWRSLAWAASLVVATGIGWYASELRIAKPAGFAKDVADSSSQPSAAPTDVATADRDALAKSRAAPPAVVGQLDEQKAEADQAAGQRQAPPPAPAAAPAPQPAAEAPAAAAQAQELAEAAAPAGEERARNEPSPLQPGLADRAQEPAPPARPSAGFAPAPALGAYKTAEASALQPVQMEEAVRILGGTIRLLDGLTPARILTGPGRLVPGADPGRDLVRVVYADPPARELWLDQQRIGPDEAPANQALLARRANPLLPGDTLVTTQAGGRRSLQWIDQDVMRLALTGYLPVDSLQFLARRVR